MSAELDGMPRMMPAFQQLRFLFLKLKDVRSVCGDCETATHLAEPTPRTFVGTVSGGIPFGMHRPGRSKRNLGLFPSKGVRINRVQPSPKISLFNVPNGLPPLER